MLLVHEILSNIILGDFNVPFTSYSTFEDYTVTYSAYYSYYYTASSFHGGITAGDNIFDSINEVNGQQPQNIFWTTIFEPDVGFHKGTISFDFTDPDIRADGNLRFITSNFNTQLLIRKTKSTTLTLYTASTQKSYTDITTELLTANRDYTRTTATSLYLNAIGDENLYCNSIIGEKIVIQPHYGQYWTYDGDTLMYMHLFTSEGTYGEYHTGIYQDNINSTIEIDVVSTSIAPNYFIESNQTSTIISEKTYELEIDSIVYTSEKTITFNGGYYYNDYQLISNSNTSAIVFFPEKQTRVSSYTFQSSYSQEGPTDALYQSGFVTTTCQVNIITTSISSFFWFTYTDSASYEVKVTANTTTSLEYVLAEVGSSASDSTAVAGFTSGVTQIYRPFFGKKQLYSLLCPNEGNPVFFTQESPAYNFAVANSSSFPVFRKSIVPENRVTDCYFSSYKYFRYGVFRNPPFFEPINFTSTSYSESNSFSIYQNVNIPKEFYIGDSGASISKTTITFNSLSSSLSSDSFTIKYENSEDALRMGQITLNDFYVQPNEVSNIYHTIGVENNQTGNASWSFDGYYYWSDSERVTAGLAENPISIIGNGNPKTIIASAWMDGGLAWDNRNAFVSITKTYQNSYV